MSLSLSWFTHLLFITIRLGTVLLFIPLHIVRQAPIVVRLLFVFILSLLISNFVPSVPHLEHKSLWLSGLVEFFNGLLLAMSLYAAFSVVQIAGQLIDNQTGFNAMAVFNPLEHHQESLSAHLLSMLATLFFFNIDGHLYLFKALAYSFTVIPVGTMTLFSGYTPIVKQFGLMFSMALMLAAPIILFLWVIDLCSALITRHMPQMNLYFLMLPLKIILSFILLILILPQLNSFITLIFEQYFHSWRELMS